MTSPLPGGVGNFWWSHRNFQNVRDKKFSSVERNPVSPSTNQRFALHFLLTICFLTIKIYAELHICNFAYMTVGRIQNLQISALNQGLLALLEVRRNGTALRDQYRIIINLPEKLASETDTKFVVVFDEFQECAKLNSFKDIKNTIGNVFKFFRSNWQRHTNISYLISGSEVTLLKKIIHEESSPFFQHFNSMPIREFSFSSAKEMFSQLLESSGYRMSNELLDKLVNLTNGHPFYLQVLGEEFCKVSPQKNIPEDVYKTVVQETLFENAGRLYLYFAGQYAKHIKTSTSLEKTLISISAENHKVSEIAKELGQSPGVVSSFINRLLDMDILIKNKGEYHFRDPVFGLWIAGTKSHLKSVISPYTLGNFVEKTVADKLSKEGFSLVYQSKASRGTFDLLAILNSFMVGIQVKKTTKFPFYLSKDEAFNPCFDTLISFFFFFSTLITLIYADLH